MAIVVTLRAWLMRRRLGLPGSSGGATGAEE